MKKKNAQNNMKRVTVNLDQMQAFVIIKDVGMMINANAGVNATN